MYAVIFKAEIRELDQAYADTAAKMRQLALEKYGCLEFIVTTEGSKEIAISYWNNLDNIAQWKEDKEHQQAQMLGKQKWYKSYQVQVVEVIREYGHAS